MLVSSLLTLSARPFSCHALTSGSQSLLSPFLSPPIAVSVFTGSALAPGLVFSPAHCNCLGFDWFPPMSALCGHSSGCLSLRTHHSSPQEPVAFDPSYPFVPLALTYPLMTSLPPLSHISLGQELITEKHPFAQALNYLPSVFSHSLPASPKLLEPAYPHLSCYPVAM